MKKTIIGILMVAVLAVSLTIGLVACNSNTDESYGYVSLKINPEVGMVVDSDGNVVSYSAENADAEVLLANTDLTGMTVEDASEKVVELAVEAGYIDTETEGEEIEVGAIDCDGNPDGNAYGKIKDSINRYFQNNGIFGKVTEDTLTQYGEQAYALGLSNGRTKMLLLAAQISGKSVDELKDSKPSELMKIIHAENGKKMRNRGQNGNSENSNALNARISGNAEKLQQHKNQYETCNQEEVRAQIQSYQQENNG